jgi:hypothetical protein
MGDEQSFSDWESVHEEYAGDDKQQMKPKVVVELPPGGIINSSKDKPPDPPHQQDQASSVGSSFVRNVGALNVKNAIKEDDASSLSSFGVPVSRLEKMRLPSSDESSSSWSHVPSQQASEWSYTAVGWTSAASSTVGSVTSNFDIISLSSGHTVVRCKRCTFHNPPNTTVCALCDLALNVNPCFDMDEQIARNLQRKEESEAFTILQEQERKRSHLRDDTLFSQATFLTQEIQAFVKDFASTGFRTFLECDMKCLVAEFIKSAQALISSKVSFAYKFTMSDTKMWNAIRTRGFAPDAQMGVAVSNNMEAAWRLEDSFGLSPHSQSKPRQTGLFSIAEDSDDTKFAPYHGWIVALVTSENKIREEIVKLTSGTGIAQIFPCSHHVLPLVCFNAHLRNRDEIRRLVNGLSLICRNFFDFSLNMDTADMPPPPKRPRVVKEDADEEPTSSNKSR